jgi:hypothetical protein
MKYTKKATIKDTLIYTDFFSVSIIDSIFNSNIDNSIDASLVHQSVVFFLKLSDSKMKLSAGFIS